MNRSIFNREVGRSRLWYLRQSRLISSHFSMQPWPQTRGIKERTRVGLDGPHRPLEQTPAICSSLCAGHPKFKICSEKTIKVWHPGGVLMIGHRWPTPLMMTIDQLPPPLEIASPALRQGWRRELIDRQTRSLILDTGGAMQVSANPVRAR